MCVPDFQVPTSHNCAMQSSTVLASTVERVCAESDSDARTREAATSRAGVDVSTFIRIHSTVHIHAVSADELTSVP
jgi:hypothetical protein